MADDEQSRHPQAFQLLYDTYRHMDCPAAVDPVDPDDCASVAEESVRVLMDAGLLLPSGGEVSTQYTVHATTKDGRVMPGLVVHHSLEVAQKWKVRLAAERSNGKVSLAIHERWARTWKDGPIREAYGPWSPVVSDNSEVPDGD